MLQKEKALIILSNGTGIPIYDLRGRDIDSRHKKWKEEYNSIICLSCKSEAQLLKLYEKYSQLTPAVKFFEPDVDEWTSICLYGTPQIRKSLSHLPLALKNKSVAV
jgi:hypothetical protein